MATAQREPEYAAIALLAFARGSNEDDPDMPLVGAALVAEFLALVRGLLKG